MLEKLIEALSSEKMSEEQIKFIQENKDLIIKDLRDVIEPWQKQEEIVEQISKKLDGGEEKQEESFDDFITSDEAME